MLIHRYGKNMRLFITIILIFVFQSCTNDINEFLNHKRVMENLFGPCEWKYVGIDTRIDNPAITIKPPQRKEYVLWNQDCERE